MKQERLEELSVSGGAIEIQEPAPDPEHQPDQDYNPTYDLAAEEAILPRLLLGRTIYVHMRPYSDREYKDLQEARATRILSGQDFVDFKDSGKTETSIFFWKHFVRLSGPGMSRADGSVGTPEEHHAWVKAHPRFDFENSVTRSWLQPALKPNIAETELAGSLLDLGNEETRVTLYQDFYQEQTEHEARVYMTHVFRPETEMDRRRFMTASGLMRFYHTIRESERRINYDTLGQLYNHLVVRLEGILLDGKPCDESNKDAWVKLVPFAYKDLTLVELFKGVQEKNVS